jgi:hypothetical protein
VQKCRIKGGRGKEKIISKVRNKIQYMQTRRKYIKTKGGR